MLYANRLSGAFVLLYLTCYKTAKKPRLLWFWFKNRVVDGWHISFEVRYLKIFSTGNKTKPVYRTYLSTQVDISTVGTEFLFCWFCNRLCCAARGDGRLLLLFDNLRNLCPLVCLYVYGILRCELLVCCKMTDPIGEIKVAVRKLSCSSISNSEF